MELTASNVSASSNLQTLEEIYGKDYVTIINTLLKINNSDLTNEFTLEINFKVKDSTNKLMITNKKKDKSTTTPTPTTTTTTTPRDKVIDINSDCNSDYNSDNEEPHCKDCDEDGIPGEYHILNTICPKSSGTGTHDLKLINPNTHIEGYQCVRCYRMGNCLNILREIKQKYKTSSYKYVKKNAK